MAEHPRQLDIPPGVWGSDDAAEVFRAWIVDNGLDVSFRTAFDSPSTWGILLVDIARHVARGFETDGVCSQEQALEQIKAMFDAEWHRSSDLGTTESRQ
ncbi:DUF5076 domain-containing protein [Kaistia dalseonensis]|uniref:DUF5076 domain-containing protein n=1 Tax=Kaistia dalseonensis TaxID=410840 RepID=A0ABU0H333_9HYPH|nr:DUF5076 domain-containing protein [Kaistia dalseonensis]MCX5494116.1 DUF5076 domain-containing protein [Kaistia dalseonensis]MDQ0436695.1 hypothetical protein [Kaistia dalseonensis]